ncbi:hypothetical protein IMY05_C1295000500 [Salix suchowensis]|nr:hypothetical protein IMY05_C1295000500 [Salix suchowensis]
MAYRYPIFLDRPRCNAYRHGLRTREEPPTHVGDPALNLTETDFFLTDRPHRFIKTTPNGDYGWYSCIRQMTKILKSSPDKVTNALSTAAHWQYLWEASEAILSPSTPAANITLRSRTPVIRQNIYNTRLHDSFNSTPRASTAQSSIPLHRTLQFITASWSGQANTKVHLPLPGRGVELQSGHEVPSLPDCDDVQTALVCRHHISPAARRYMYAQEGFCALLAGTGAIPGQNTALITMLVADEAINAITRSARVVCFSIERQRVGADELGGTVHIRGSATATHPGGGCGSIPACDVGEERRTTSSLKKRGRRATVFRARGET